MLLFMDELNNQVPQTNNETTPTPSTPPVTEAASVPEPSVVPAEAAPTATPTPALASPLSVTSVSPVKKDKAGKKPILMILVLLVAVLISGLGGYMVSNSKSNKALSKANASIAALSKEKEISIPQGATVIAQCSKGRGTQYALPKDIPLGPVYNVYEGKVIGIEYMVGKDDLLGASKNFLNLPLADAKFDHVNIGLLSQGHAGFPAPHYHVDIMTVPSSVTDKITCPVAK